MDIETLHLASIMDADRFGDVDYFVRHTAFIICHKSEPVDTLLTILRYIPADSPRIVVTNCAPKALPQLQDELSRRLTSRGATYLIHQKDERVAHFFKACGVTNILDASGAVADGKGEGMYIGAILAALLGIAEWIVYFDADNYAPSALLEYILAMGQLFTPSSGAYPSYLGYHEYPERASLLTLHNVRICWASKPHYDGVAFIPQPRVLGRCTEVIAPLCDEVLQAWNPENTDQLLTPNAGEQGMTMATAKALRFSSGFSIETFQLLELASASMRSPGAITHARLQQYMSGSPHLHEKKDGDHIRGMIAESLGSFLAFRRHLPQHLLARIADLASDLDIPLTRPRTYPAIGRLPLARHGDFLDRFRLDACVEVVPA
ncbi:MAG TPA: mannosyl-3-phosphoglycerate synthase [Ktedonobacterales bacterium]|nr:mannosyl-3-phosphoglycerate synthase [Ktedonobacterales bacterium]